MKVFFALSISFPRCILPVDRTFMAFPVANSKNSFIIQVFKCKSVTRVFVLLQNIAKKMLIIALG